MPKAWASSELNRHVAINVDPQILVVDEALSVGDERFRRKCFSRIETIKNDGATILFVSHSGSAVVELCDRAMLLDSGEELAIGTPKIIVGKYQRLLYAADDKRSAIREEIRSSTVSVDLPERIIQPCVEAKASSNEGLPGDGESEEFFDPSLVPQSTLAYESQGAQIESPQIRTLAGDKVNCLKRGRTSAIRTRFASTEARTTFDSAC